MKERPILFSAPMVRAILDGRKSQTRRVVKPVGNDDGFVLLDYGDGFWPYRSDDGYTSILSDGNEIPHNCPYGYVGDMLWVREGFSIVPRTAYARSDGVEQTLRPGDDHDAAIYREGWVRSRGGFSWKPSIHMPRWASRILLEVTGVRVERLNDISEADAKAEGAMFHDGRGIGHSGWRHNYKDVYSNARSSFARLWQEINGPGSWESNPWVWVIEFKMVNP